MARTAVVSQTDVPKPANTCPISWRRSDRVRFSPTFSCDGTNNQASSFLFQALAGSLFTVAEQYCTSLVRAAVPTWPMHLNRAAQRLSECISKAKALLTRDGSVILIFQEGKDKTPVALPVFNWTFAARKRRIERAFGASSAKHRSIKRE